MGNKTTLYSKYFSLVNIVVQISSLQFFSFIVDFDILSPVS